MKTDSESSLQLGDGRTSPRSSHGEDDEELVESDVPEGDDAAGMTAELDPTEEVELVDRDPSPEERVEVNGFDVEGDGSRQQHGGLEQERNGVEADIRSGVGDGAEPEAEVDHGVARKLPVGLEGADNEVGETSRSAVDGVTESGTEEDRAENQSGGLAESSRTAGATKSDSARGSSTGGGAVSGGGLAESCGTGEDGGRPDVSRSDEDLDDVGGQLLVERDGKFRVVSTDDVIADDDVRSRSSSSSSDQATVSSCSKVKK